ncbi:hypothetical protein Tco_0609371 [Tanacetum coccineum]
MGDKNPIGTLRTTPNLATRATGIPSSSPRTIDQSAGGKLRDLNAEESWALLEDLGLYDNEIQCLMEAHLALTQPTQVNKVTPSCEICSGPHDTQYCMEDPEQAFVEYAFSQTDEAGEGLVSEFMASQDARLSKFEANFKRQQGEMTNKIDTVLKAITDQIAGILPSDTVKNPKLGTHPVFANKAHFKEATISQTSLQQPVVEIEPPQSEEPEPTPEDEFQDLHLNLSVLEFLAHAPIYNAILDKYVESLELGKNGLAFVQGEIPAKMEDLGLFTLPCRLGDSKPFDNKSLG